MMRSILPLLLVIPCLARAATLHTAPASAAFADVMLLCKIRNVGTSPREVTIDTLDFAGAVVATSTQVLEPGVASGYSDETSASCRFSFGGSAKHMRAQALYLDIIDSETIRTMITIPAD
jgi:hypothetical protein